jgi:hypothetical protein
MKRSYTSVHWYYIGSLEPNEETGLSGVKPDFDDDGKPDLAIIHVDTIICAAHLIPVYGWQFIRR